MNKNTIKNSHFDKFNVEATSINDLDGCATTEATGLIPAMRNPSRKLTPIKKYFPTLLIVMWRKQTKKESSKRLIFSFFLLSCQIILLF